MGVFEQFPYTNFHDLNLDWILNVIKELDKKIEAFVQENVLTYADPLQWNITSQYAKNTVVVDPVTGTAYMSTEAVPSGVLLTNSNYWQPIFNYKETVTNLKQQIAGIDTGDSGEAPADIKTGDLVWYRNKLYQAIRNIDTGNIVVVNTSIVPVTVEQAIHAIKYSGNLARTAGENITDQATGDYTNTAGGTNAQTASAFTRTANNGNIEDITGADTKRTAENIIDTATGDYTETAGDKTENYNNRTETDTGDVLENVTGKKTVNAEDIILNPANPLTYKAPENINDIFDYIPFKTIDGQEYQVLVNKNVNISNYTQIIKYEDQEDITDILNTALSHGNVMLTGTGSAIITKQIVIPNDKALLGNNADIMCGSTFNGDYAISVGTEQIVDYSSSKASLYSINIDCNKICNGVICKQAHATIENVKIKNTITGGIGIQTQAGNTRIYNCVVISPLTAYNTGIDIAGNADGIIDGFISFGTKIGIHMHETGGGELISNVHILAYDSDAENSDWENSIGILLEGPDANLTNIYVDNFRTGIKATKKFSCTNLFCFCYEYKNKANRYACDLSTNAFLVDNASVDDNATYYYINPENVFYMGTGSKAKFTFRHIENLKADDPCCIINFNKITNFPIEPAQGATETPILVSELHQVSRALSACVSIINEHFTISGILLKQSWESSPITVLDTGTYKAITTGYSVTLNVKHTGTLYYITLTTPANPGTIHVHSDGFSCIKHNLPMPTVSLTTDFTHQYK